MGQEDDEKKEGKKKRKGQAKKAMGKESFEESVLNEVNLILSKLPAMMQARTFQQLFFTDLVHVAPISNGIKHPVEIGYIPESFFFIFQ